MSAVRTDQESNRQPWWIHVTKHMSSVNDPLSTRLCSPPSHSAILFFIPPLRKFCKFFSHSPSSAFTIHFPFQTPPRSTNTTRPRRDIDEIISKIIQITDSDRVLHILHSSDTETHHPKQPQIGPKEPLASRHFAIFLATYPSSRRHQISEYIEAHH